MMQCSLGYSSIDCWTWTCQYNMMHQSAVYHTVPGCWRSATTYSCCRLVIPPIDEGSAVMLF